MTQHSYRGRFLTVVVIPFAIALTCTTVRSQEQAGPKAYTSHELGYTVQYPAGWRLEGSNRFVIYDFPLSLAVRGNVIPDGGAGIYLVVPSELQRGKAAPNSLDEWISLGLEHKRITGKRQIQLSRDGKRLAITEATSWCCGTLPPDLEMIEWFFEVDGRMYLAGIEYSGKVDVASLRETLEQVVLSLKAI